MSGSRTYPAKLLLFGEYTVLSGSRALAVPLRLWKGRWSEADTTSAELTPFADYLDRENILPEPGMSALKTEVERGLTFESSIPRGYGVGSSGALCAAVFDRFFAPHAPAPDIHEARRLLARMESHFHGQSSGMDPLVSLNDAAVLREADKYHVLAEHASGEHVHVFLLDSGIARSTEHLVTAYLQSAAQPAFQTGCLRPLIQSTDHAISFFIDFHADMLFAHLHLISALQLQYMPEMIPGGIAEVWRQALDGDRVVIKLCGAGGGGFFLGFARGASDLEAFRKRCPYPVTQVFPG